MTRKVFLKAMVTVVLVFGLLIFPSVLAAQGNSGAAFNRVKAVQEAHTGVLMARTGVVGTAIGLGQAGQPVVLVLLEKAGVAIPTSLDGVQVRPYVTGIISALNKPDDDGEHDHGGGGGGEEVDPTTRFDRPVPIGVSTGANTEDDCFAGTIGARLTDGTDVYALSNNHVYARENQALPLSPILQPGSLDHDPGICVFDEDDEIGALIAFVPIVFGGGTNTIDAAIALSDPDLLGNATPSDGYGLPKSATVSASLNQKVKKYSRSTGLTKGQVFAVNAFGNITYSTGVAFFEGQIMITPGGFSGPGDSGALVVVDGKGKTKRDDRKPVGLLFAGSPTVTLANPIGAVLDGLSDELGWDLFIDGE